MPQKNEDSFNRNSLKNIRLRSKSISFNVKFNFSRIGRMREKKWQDIGPTVVLTHANMERL